MAAAVLHSPIPTNIPGNHMSSSSSTSKSPEPKGFKRIRSSLENTIRTATRSKAKPPVADDHGDAGRTSSMMKKLEKVTFRKGKEASGSSDKDSSEKDTPFEPFVSPSLRKATMSSPTLSRAPSVFTHSPVLPSPRSSASKPRERRVSAQPTISSRDISGPTPLTPRTKSHKSSNSVPVIPNQSISKRGLVSSSSSYLPSTSASPPSSPTIRQPRYEPRDMSPSPPTTPPPRRSTMDRHAPRSPVDRGPLSSSPPPSPSPVPKVRPRERSPAQRVYSQNRLINTSNLSLAVANMSSSTVNLSASPSHHIASPSGSHFPISPQRESIRSATSLLLREVRAGSKHKDWDEVELRIRALARAERVWGKSSSSASSNSPQTGSLAGEERERKLFVETLKDGYVLCFLINRLSPRPVVLPSISPSAATSNVNKFLAACSSHGLAQEDVFQSEDLLISEDLDGAARVAQTITALVQHVPSRIYTTGRAASSTPNLGLTARANGKSPPPHCGTPSPSPTTAHRASPEFERSPTRERDKKRYSPPSALPPVRSESPNSNGPDDGNDEEASQVKPDDILTLPPRSPLRARTSTPPLQGPAALSRRNKASGLSPSSTMFPILPASPRDSVATTTTRQSIMSDTNSYSSLLEVSRVRLSSSVTKFGTIRTMTTDITSVDGDDSYMQGEMDEKPEPPENPPSPRERKKPAPIYLGKGKWPEDFMLPPPKEDSDTLFGADNDDDLLSASGASLERSLSPSTLSNHSSSSPLHSSPNDSLTRSSTPTFGSSSRKVAIAGTPRRPTHRPRQSADGIILSGSPSLRNASPDSLTGISTGSPRLMLRRHTTKHGYHLQARNRDSSDDISKPASPVPFPRTSSGEHPTPQLEKPKVYRGRFQSEIDGTGPRRKARPDSFDELGNNSRGTAGRSRIESMVNIGGASPSTERASDLLRWNSDAAGHGQPVRKTLVIKEPGKPATHFQLGNCIGRGQFGSVYRALNLNTGQMVAVKQLRLEGLNEEEVTQLMKEVDLVKSLSHPGIVKYEGMARDQDTLSIVLEYAENGSLGQTLKAFGKLNERLVASYAVKILEGLDYLHSSGVVHCDLKAGNILTTKNGNIKLSDFGVSLNLRAMEKESGVGGTSRPANYQASPNDVAGTPHWMAPEVIELKGASPKSDIWSLGCTVIELLTGRPPYADVSNTMTVMFRIVEDDCPPLPEDCSPLLREFLLECFHKDPARRPSAVELCEHQWLKKNWSGHKEIQPQDSIPFLRRVSADLQKSEAIRYLSQIEMPPRDDSKSDVLGSSPPHLRRPRLSQQSAISPTDHDQIAPREHAFVKTTFSKPMICRVCLLHVKKSAVLCAQCSLIAHSKCSPNSPPTCDLRAQLLLYAQYAEKGNPSSVYANPVDLLSEALPKGPMSDVSYVAGSAHNSVDQPLKGSQPISIPSRANSTTTSQTSTPIPGSPLTGFNLMARLKRSRQNLAADASQSTSSLNASKSDVSARGRARRERPDSISSDSNTTIGSSRTRNSRFSTHSVLTNVAEGDRFVEIPSPALSPLPVSPNGAKQHLVPIPGGFSENNQSTAKLPHKRLQSKPSGNCNVQ